MGDHNVPLLILTILVPVAFVVVCVFNGLTGTDIGRSTFIRKKGVWIYLGY